MRSKANKISGEEGGDVEDDIDDEEEAVRRQVSQCLIYYLVPNELLHLGSA
jgi:hypothetical protein